MQDKPMLILAIILTTLICLYFYFAGFSSDRWVRYGQYGGLGFCALLIIDNMFRD